ncbi:hypothetical protein, partial [Cellulomonas carbonis]
SAENQLDFSVRLVSEILPALHAAGLRDTPEVVAALGGGNDASDLRGRLGLAPAVNLYADA